MPERGINTPYKKGKGMYKFVNLNGTAKSMENDLRNGLLSDPKYIPSYFIYDAEGSRLFEKICDLPEYYLMRREKEILEKKAEDIAGFIQPGGTIVEFGCGNACKTKIIIEHCLEQHGRLKYVPVDISSEMLIKTSENLYKQYDDLDVTACRGEYFEGLDYLKQIPGQKFVLWLGSSIGNFDKQEAARFVGRVKKRLGSGDGLLIGIDLRKDPALLEKAYNDSRGITSRYHLNCLDRFNREFDADFKKDRFYHCSVYNERSGTINAYIISKCRQEISVRDLGVRLLLKKGEKIFNERSCKFNKAEILELAKSSGMEITRQWFDEDRYYSFNLFR